MAPHNTSILGWSFSARTASVSVAAVVFTVAACSTERRSEQPAPVEKIGTSAKALQSADFDGSSLGDKQIALSFDDGPGSRTLELSAFLKAQGIHATFFSNGHCFDADNPCGNPGLTPAQVYGQVEADGHLVANHTQDHVDLTSQFPNDPAGNALLLAQVTDTDTLIAPYVQYNHFLLRPPYGDWTAPGPSRPYNVLHPTAMDKYVGPIRWDIGGQMVNMNDAVGYGADWDCWQNQDGFGAKTATQCATRYMNEIHAVGHGITLMHDSDSSPNMGNHNVNSGTGNTIDMVKLILIPQLLAEHYTFVRVDDVPAIHAALPPCDATCSACSGPGATNCTACTDGKYLSGGACVACNAACATCSGAGASACTSCSGNTYLAGSTCTTCSTCSATEYVAAACTNTTNTSCAACDASCATCNGAGAAACASCKANTYLNGQRCTACSACGPSKYQITACAGSADTVCGACDPSCTVCAGPSASQCGACPPKNYLDAGACHACTDCTAGSVATAACSTTANTTCTQCAPGKFAASAGATSCTPCAAGTFSTAAGSKSCTACPAGTFSEAGASACTPCAAGTFSGTAGAATCAACAAGTQAAAGAASCKGCGDCNDNDACTQDSCDAVKGCSHTPVQGCSPKDTTVPVDAGDTVPPAKDGDGGCAIAHGSRSSGLLLMSFGTLAMLLWRRRSAARRALS